MSDTFTYKGKVYPKLNAKFVWTLGHFDGPMSGIALFEDTYYFAKCHQYIHARPPRYYWLYPMTSEELAAEQRYQAMFRYYIGFHCDKGFDAKSRETYQPDPNDLKWFLKIRETSNEKYFRGWEDRPTYSEMQQKAGIIDSERKEYLKRDAIGYFTLH